MSVIRELQEQVAQIQTAEFVTTMLRDISATRLQAIRAVYDANHAYYESLHRLMALVKRYAAQHSINPYSDISESGSVIVVLTSNKRFYGGLNETVMKRFYELAETLPDAQLVIVGRVGELYAKRRRLKQQPTIFTSTADILSEGDITRLIASLTQYQSVIVVHPHFVTSFRQEPKNTDITHRPIRDSDAVHEKHLEYICEPELPAIMAFFRTHVRHVLLARVVLEMQVALTGARLMKMQRARERAEELVLEGRRNLHKEMSTIKSLRLLETFAGFTSDRTL